MIRGLGIDRAELAPIVAAFGNGISHDLPDQLCTEEEGKLIACGFLEVATLFSMKESVMKALGYGFPAIGFDDIEILNIAPAQIRLYGLAREAAFDKSISRWHFSVAHDGRFVHTVAIAE